MIEIEVKVRDQRGELKMERLIRDQLWPLTTHNLNLLQLQIQIMRQTDKQIGIKEALQIRDQINSQLIKVRSQVKDQVWRGIYEMMRKFK